MSEARFRDREDAGRSLARRLGAFAHRPDVVVLGLPRGGVPVAFEVATALDAPLDVFVVRKLGVPGHEELAMGAIASDGTRVLNEELVRSLDLDDEAIESVARREEAELARRERLYREGRSPLDVAGKIVIVVDDGLATGATMRASVAALERRGPGRIVVAVPVGAPDTCDALGDHADEVVCDVQPEPFRAVGLWYRDFSQTTDDEVRALLARAHAAAVRPRPFASR